MTFFKMYIIAFIIFLAIDAIWLGLVAPKFYKAQIGHLMADKPNLVAALVFYLIFIVGVVYFVVNPAVEAQSITKVLVAGVLFGLITYATYDLTNLATLKSWPLTIVFIDILWGTTLSAIVSFSGFYIVKWIN